MDPLALDEVIAELPSLHAKALDHLANRAPNALATYALLRSEAQALDLTSDAATDFRRRFNGYYGVRRNQEWREDFYRIFQAAKGWDLEPALIFDRALHELAEAQNRTEASFVSKMVATLHPASPVIDSIVRKFLAARTSAPRFGKGVYVASNYYRWLAPVMETLSRGEAGAAWSTQLEAVFPQSAGVHPVKQLDFLIWAGSRA